MIGTAVLIVTMLDDDTVFTAMKAGARDAGLGR
jgi:hypothetical protein